jgi:hypothetical protein
MQRIQKLTIIVTLCLMLITGCARQSASRHKQLVIEEAVTAAFAAQAQAVKYQEIVFLLHDVTVDHIVFDEAHSQALVWFAILDEDTGSVLGSEPGLALATLTNEDPTEPRSWQILFRHDPDWSGTLWQLSENLLDTVDKQLYTAKNQAVPHNGQIFTGYKLPWAKGEAMKLTQSIGHVYIYKTCPDACLYAFDFWNGTMFPLSAAKGGIVKYAVWQHPNGNTTHTNYLVIEDPTTTPKTYALYFHLAQDSIPVDLRTPGAVVQQGQFIGNADDTGGSTAHHLHFMVHTNPHSYWGTSVDIVFDEVTMNGGRPRTCMEAGLYPELGDECVTGDWFVSDNAADQPPTAWITQPQSETTITDRTLTVKAQAQDNEGILSMQLFLGQADQGWMTIDQNTNAKQIETTIDLCQLDLPDGIIDLAVSATDVRGKTVDTKHTPVQITKQFYCDSQPPACQPAEEQIALYTEPNYRGRCALVDVGDYYGMIYVDGIENDEVSSLLVGENVYAILYESTNLKGIYEVFTQSDPDLSDNTIGDKTTSSLQVIELPPLPAKPVLPANFTVYETDNIIVSWTGDAEDYRAVLMVNDEIIMTRDWGVSTTFEIGTLPAGSYKLIVRARNISGVTSAAVYFDVIASPHTTPITNMVKLPINSKNTTITLAWEVLAGADNVASFDLQYRVNDSNWKAIDSNIDPSLRSYIVVLNPGFTYEFRIRAIAIQGSHEALKPTAETRIDILSRGCPIDPHEPNDTPELANQIKPGETQPHFFCPANDIDWLQFDAQTDTFYRLKFDMPDGSLPLSVDVYNPAAQLYTNRQIDPQGNTDLTIRTDSEGEWTVRISPHNPLVLSPEIAYTVTLQELRLSSTTLVYTAAGVSIVLTIAGVTLLLLLIKKRRK